MKFNPETKELAFNSKNDEWDINELLSHKDVTKLRINNVHGDVSLPDELISIVSLTELSFYSEKRENTYRPPTNLHKMTNLKNLVLWSYCELDKLGIMPHIESLEIVVKEPLCDVMTLIKVFPNLKELEFWGSHLKERKLPAEFGNWSSLESLSLISCGLSSLPDEFKNLTSLKKLKFVGLKMKVFPDIICEMPWIEELDFRQEIATLPSEFSKLSSLKRLSLSRSFNKGTTDPVKTMSGRKVYLKEIPPVIGELHSLEHLDLAACGVVDIEFLKDLTNLKSLNLSYSGLKNLKQFCSFKMLEVLDLNSSEYIKDIAGLEGLPITELLLDGCDSLENIEGLLSLEKLNELDIKYCGDIKNLDPLYQHPTIKVLNASSEILKQWKIREKFKNLPEISTVIKDCSSSSLQDFEKAIGHLLIYVDRDYNDSHNPLAGFFDQRAHETELTTLEILESGFMKHKETLSSDAIVQILNFSFRAVGYDNYEITLFALKELIKRRDGKGQSEFIKIFYKACSRYDFGHREYGYTVYDQIIDDIFDQFETEAQIILFKNSCTDMLNCEGGDGVDRVYISAFKNCRSDEYFKELMTTFFKYHDDALEYLGLSYFTELRDAIYKNLSAEKLSLFDLELQERAGQQAQLELLENGTAEGITTLISSFRDEMDEEFFESKDYVMISTMNKLDMPFETVQSAIDFYFEKETCSRDVASSLLKFFVPKGVDFSIAYLESKSVPDGHFACKVLLEMFYSMNKANIPIKEMDPYRKLYLQTKCSTNKELYSIEIDSILKALCDYRVDEKEEQYLIRFEELVSLMNGHPTSARMDLFSLMYELVTAENYKKLKRLTLSLFSILPSKQIEVILFFAIVGSVKTNDEEFFNYLSSFIPKEVERELLAYNLACACAKFNKKPELLKYAALSIELGKTAQQFLDDQDFERYYQDEDFLNSLKQE